MGKRVMSFFRLGLPRHPGRVEPDGNPVQNRKRPTDLSFTQGFNPKRPPFPDRNPE